MKPWPLLFWMVSCLSFTVTFGQTVPTFPALPIVQPQAAQLQKYIDYPVNLTTGLVDISVPLYTIESHGIKVPISLKYHAGGIKYDDVCEGVGLGWTLFAGGMVTYNQRGAPDNFDTVSGFNFRKIAASIDPTLGCGLGDNTSLISCIQGANNSEFDIFNFSFGDKSGMFFFPYSFSPVISPSQNLSIAPYPAGGNGVGSSTNFNITDEDGTLYRFGYYSIDTNSNTESGSFFAQTTSTKFLTEIISADKGDTVRFFYSQQYGDDAGSSYPWSKLVINDQTAVRDQFQYPSGDHSYADPLDPSHQTSASNYTEGFGFVQLTGITFRTGHVTFNYGASNMLLGMNVYSYNSTTPLKVITLNQSNYGSDYYKLDQVNFFDNASQKSYNYKFAYNGTPYNRQYTGIDYWGFHNGASYVTDYVPNFQVQTDFGTLTVGGMDRTPNEPAMQQGMLNKITYPTGGSSVFTFEAHRHDGGQLAGGLRIKKIDNYDLDGSYKDSKWYTYGQNETGDGIIYRAINPSDFCYTDIDYDDDGIYTPVGTPGGPPSGYAYRERVYGAFPKFSYTQNGSSVSYDYVTEYSGDGVNANGKTVYHYEYIPDQFNTQNWTQYIPMVYLSNTARSGKLLSRSVYKKDGPGYTLIDSTLNTYQDFKIQYYHCLKEVLAIDWHDAGTSDVNRWYGLACLQSAPWYHMVFSDQWVQADVAYADYNLPTGTRLLTNSTEIRDGVSQYTQYTYDPTYLKPVKIQTTKSNGDTSLVENTYPFNLTTTPYTSMVAQNILDPVIVQKSFKNNESNFLSSTTNNYAGWGTNQFLPQSVATQTLTNPAETRLVYDAYDGDGNILQRHKASGTPECYIWAYAKRYPVAKVLNAASNDVFFDGFEDGDGNSALNDEYTGHYSYSGSYSKALTGLDAGSYTLSYRQKSGSVWNLVTTAVTVSGSSYTISLSGQVDDVRFCPAAAQMTTYTYDPLIGMTSSTDLNGLAAFYEYDNFQRLMNVRDKDGNIIKHIDYHYQGQ